MIGKEAAKNSAVPNFISLNQTYGRLKAAGEVHNLWVEKAEEGLIRHLMSMFIWLMQKPQKVMSLQELEKMGNLSELMASFDWLRRFGNWPIAATGEMQFLEGMVLRESHEMKD